MKKLVALMTTFVLFFGSVQTLLAKEGFILVHLFNDDLEEVMEEMQTVMRRIRRAKDVQELHELYLQFRQHVVAGMKFSKGMSAKEKDIFLNGMEGALEVVDEALEATKAGDFEKAKSYFSKLRGKKKRYHEKLNVDD